MNPFEETGLKAELLNAVQELGFITPTPIQEKIIPALLANGRDIIGLAQTGTGKRLLSDCQSFSLVISIQKNLKRLFYVRQGNYVSR